VLDNVVFTDFPYSIHILPLFGEGGVGEDYCQATVACSDMWNISTSDEVECTSRWRRFSTEVLGILDTEANIVKSGCPAIMNKCPEAASVVQQVRKVLRDIESSAGCTAANVRKRSD
jgi:hypothetical protein